MVNLNEAFACLANVLLVLMCTSMSILIPFGSSPRN
jgi:hypothetical protein